MPYLTGRPGIADFRFLCASSKNQVRRAVAILRADQNERCLWRREWAIKLKELSHGKQNNSLFFYFVGSKFSKSLLDLGSKL